MLGSQRSRAMTSRSPNPFTLPRTPTTGHAQQAHPPLGMSHFPTEDELAEHDRPGSPGALSSIVGTIRSRARSVLLPGHPDFQQGRHDTGINPKIQSPMHPVQLTEISVPAQKVGEGSNSPYGEYGLPSKTAYEGAAGVAAAGSTVSVNSSARRVQFGGDNRKASLAASDGSSLGPPPTPPPHTTRRQFSFQNVFKRHQQHAQGDAAHDAAGDAGHHFFPSIHAAARPATRPLSSRGYSNPQVKGATEEERLGLVKGDSNVSQSTPALRHYDELEEDDLDDDDTDVVEGGFYTDDKESRYGRGITGSSPPRPGSNNEKAGSASSERRRFQTPPPPPHGQRRHTPPEGGNGGAFI